MDCVCCAYRGSSRSGIAIVTTSTLQKKNVSENVAKWTGCAQTNSGVYTAYRVFLLVIELNSVKKVTQ